MGMQKQSSKQREKGEVSYLICVLVS
jgi:hypothetical protein